MGMAALFLFLSKSFVVSAILFGWYFAVLRGRKMHVLNRWYINALFLLSIVVPFTNFHLFQIPVTVQSGLSPLINAAQTGTLYVGEYTTVPSASTLSMPLIGLIIGGCFSVVLLFRLLVKVICIVRLKSKHESYEVGGVEVVMTDYKQAPFTFFRSIFWNRSLPLDENPGNTIFAHEKAHVQQLHTIDKLLTQVFTRIFWFNPFFWLAKRELELIHEYLADEAAISDCNVEQFASMVLATYQNGVMLSHVSSFSASDIKRRIAMLRRREAQRGLKFRVLFTCTIVVAVMFMFSFSGVTTNKLGAERSVEKKTIVVSLPQESLNSGVLSESSVCLKYARVLKRLGVQRNLDLRLSNDNNGVQPAFAIGLQLTNLPGTLPEKRDFEIMVADGSENADVSSFFGAKIFNQLATIGCTAPHGAPCNHPSGEQCARCGAATIAHVPPRQQHQLAQLGRTHTPGILFVIGNINNTALRNRFTDDAEIEKVCSAMLNGIAEAINQQYDSKLGANALVGMKLKSLGSQSVKPACEQTNQLPVQVK